MFRDLCQYTWPVYYDLHEVPEFAEDIIGNTSTAAYVYYFTWWLPVAGLKKLFSCSEAVSNVLLYLWTVLELFLIFYCLVSVSYTHLDVYKRQECDCLAATRTSGAVSALLLSPGYRYTYFWNKGRYCKNEYKYE